MAIQGNKKSNGPLGGPIGKLFFALMIFVGIPVTRWGYLKLANRAPSERQVNSVLDNLPEKGIYSSPEGSGGNFREPKDKAFEVEIPENYNLVSNYLFGDSKRIRWVEFECGRRQIRCGVIPPPYESETIGTSNSQYRARRVTIDGVEGIEEAFSMRKDQYVKVAYEKYGYKYIVTVRFPKGKFPKYANEFLNIFRSFRALPPE